MPNRIDTGTNGIRPPQTTRSDARLNNRAEQTATQSPPSQTQNDRVEISDQARSQVEASRPRVGSAQANRNGAAANAPSARPPEAGDQGAVENETQNERAAESSRQQQETTARESAERPQARQGSLVDVVG